MNKKTANLIEIFFILFVVGALLGPVCDFFHVASKTTWYAKPFLFGMPWWEWPLFGFATAAIGLGALFCDGFFKQKIAPRPWRDVMAALMWFVVIYFVSGFLKPEGLLKIIVLDLMVTAMWYQFDRTSYSIYFGLAVALVGCSFEIGLSHLGVFFYTRPHLFGIAAWLPFLYIAAALAVGNLARRLQAGV